MEANEIICANPPPPPPPPTFLPCHPGFTIYAEICGGEKNNATTNTTNANLATEYVDPLSGIGDNLFTVGASMFVFFMMILLLLVATLAIRASHGKAEMELLKKREKHMQGIIATAQEHIDKLMKPSADGTDDGLLEGCKLQFTDISIGKILGRGSFGNVYKGQLHGETVAIKMLTPVARGMDDKVRRFRDEIELMAPLRHPNLILMFGACWDCGAEHLCLVLEYAGRGDFRRLLKDSRMNWEFPYYQIMDGTAKCFRYLHAQSPAVLRESTLCPALSCFSFPFLFLLFFPFLFLLFIFLSLLFPSLPFSSLLFPSLLPPPSSPPCPPDRDLKPENLLVNACFEAKVTDFGLSRKQEKMYEDTVMSLVGSKGYCSPEVLRRESYGPKADVFSFGIMLMEAAQGRSAVSFLKGMARQDIGTAYSIPNIPPVLRRGLPAVVELVEQCWSEDPKMRPTIEEVCARLAKMKPT